MDRDDMHVKIEILDFLKYLKSQDIFLKNYFTGNILDPLEISKRIDEFLSMGCG